MSGNDSLFVARATTVPGSTKPLNGIEQLEIWTDGKGFGHGWFADYVVVKDNQTDDEACFLIAQYLNKNKGGVRDNHLLLNKQSDRVSCRQPHPSLDDETDTVQTRRMKAVGSLRATSDPSASKLRYRRTYHVRTKTAKRGLFGLAPTGADARVFIRVHDNDGHLSEPIELKASVDHKNSFARGKIGQSHA